MPQGRRFKPKPFQRPSVSLDGPTRKWLMVKVEDLHKGDIVPDYGQVVSVEDFGKNSGMLRVSFLFGRELIDLPTSPVFAFTAEQE